MNNTYINLGLESLKKRLEEIDVIIVESRKQEYLNPSLYNSLCRSAQVLLCAHFEGYLKDLIKNSLDDLNNFSSFRDANPALKKRFCEYFIRENADRKDGKDTHLKIQELISVLDPLPTKFRKEFYYYNDNQNPKTSMIDKIAKLYGIDDIFSMISHSKLDSVFSNTNQENIQLSAALEENIFKGTAIFPYSLHNGMIGEPQPRSIPTPAPRENLWELFLSDLLKRRHDIAHGREIENAAGHSIIESDKTKIKILLFAITYFICVACNPNQNEEQPTESK